MVENIILIIGMFMREVIQNVLNLRMKDYITIDVQRNEVFFDNEIIAIKWSKIFQVIKN